jgi:kynureninase
MSLNFTQIAEQQKKDPSEKGFATHLDSLYPSLREEFHIPKNEGVRATRNPEPSKECIYFCGNSLGLQPKRTQSLVQEELDIWASRGVQGHFRHDKWPWVSIHETCTSGMAEIVGAQEDEIAIMGSLTANLHLLMASFYTPTRQRYKIIIESKAFPSDHVPHFHIRLIVVCCGISDSLAWI